MNQINGQKVVCWTCLHHDGHSLAGGPSLPPPLGSVVRFADWFAGANDSSKCSFVLASIQRQPTPLDLVMSSSGFNVGQSIRSTMGDSKHLSPHLLSRSPLELTAQKGLSLWASYLSSHELEPSFREKEGADAELEMRSKRGSCPPLFKWTWQVAPNRCRLLAGWLAGWLADGQD